MYWRLDRHAANGSSLSDKVAKAAAFSYILNSFYCFRLPILYLSFSIYFKAK